MRRQDEILLLYGGRDPLTRKYLLAELGRLGLAFDSEDAHALLGREMWDADPVVRNQALFTLSRFLPGYTAKRYGLASADRSSWTAYARALPAALEPAGALSPENAKAALAERARPVVSRLVRCAESADPRQRILALLALAHLPAPAAHEALVWRARDDADRFPATLALALAERAQAGEALARVILQAASRDPDHLLLLACLPASVVGPLAPAVFARADTRGRVDLLMTLPDLPEVDPAPVFAQLAGRVEVPVVAQALRAMELLADPRWLELVREIFARSSHEFVRIQAVRAAGGIPGDASIAFLFEALAAPQEPVRAQALESLVRREAPADVLLPAARALATSPFLRTRVNAVLALNSAGEPVANLLETVQALALGDDVLSRLEAAFCMGYVQSKRFVEYLGVYAEQDPAPAVRRQAIKSLSRFPAAVAVSPLIASMRTGDGDQAKSAMRALSRFAGDAAAFYALCECLRVEREPQRVSLMAACLGRLGAGRRAPLAAGELTRLMASSDTPVQRGAVEGWLWLGGAELAGARGALEALPRDGGAPDARVAMARVLAGDLAGLDRLAELFDAAPETGGMPAIEALLELALVIDSPALERRYPGLVAALTGRSAPAPAPAPPPSRSELDVSTTAWGVQRAPAPSLPSGPTTVPQASELARHLKKGHVRSHSNAEDLVLGLDRQNYLVGERRAAPGKKVWTAAAAVAVLLSGLAIQGALSPAAPEISGLRGTSRVTRWVVESIAGGPPRAVGWGVGQPVQEGLPIATAPGQRVRLVGPGGNRLLIEPSSVAIPRRVADGAPDLEIDVAEGTARFEVPASGRLVVGCGATRITGERARFSLTRSRSGGELAVEHGEVTVRVQKGPGRTVRARQRHALEQ